MAEGAIPKAPRLLRTGRETKVRSLPGPLPLINSGAADLLENERLIVQLTQLERRTARGGKDSIDHTPGAHDDVANAVAGALVTAFKDPWHPSLR